MFNNANLLLALKVALLVGIILNLINNPGLFSHTDQSEIHLSRIILTFIVPFCVSLYSSVVSGLAK